MRQLVCDLARHIGAPLVVGVVLGVGLGDLLQRLTVLGSLIVVAAIAVGGITYSARELRRSRRELREFREWQKRIAEEARQ
jgi:hypothetical protein